MAANINDWNVDQNIQWYVNIKPSGGQGLVELFFTREDAVAGTNRIAYGVFAFGSNVDVALTQDAASPIIGFFNSYLSYHVRVTLLVTDTKKIFRMNPFTELSEVSDPLLTTGQAILDRATLEIDRHAHIATIRALNLGTHIQNIDVNDKVRVIESMNSTDVSARVTSISTTGGSNSLMDTIEVESFEDLMRNE